MANGTATPVGTLRKRRPALRSRRFNRKRFLAYQIAGFFGVVLLLHVGYNSDQYLPSSWTGASPGLRGEAATSASVRTLHVALLILGGHHAALPSCSVLVVGAIVDCARCCIAVGRGLGRRRWGPPVEGWHI